MTRRGRAYTPKATHEAEEVIAQAWRDSNGPTFHGPVRLYVDYYTDGQWIVVEPLEVEPSKLTGDVDNYAKLTADALQLAEAVGDDRQVASLFAEKW